MDVTGGLADAVGKLPSEFQPVLNSLITSISDLEQKLLQGEQGLLNSLDGWTITLTINKPKSV